MLPRSRFYRLALVAASTGALLVTLPGVASADWTSADTTTAVSVDAGGASNGGTSPSLSMTGRYVAYTHNDRVLVRDRLTGRVTDVAPGTDPQLSSSGRLVAFRSDARLTSNDTDNESDVFVRNLATGTTVLASIPAKGMSDTFVERAPVISGNGRYVVFMMFTTDLNADADVVLVRDLQNSTTEIADVRPGTNGLPFRVSAGSPSISYDGRYVAFEGIDLDIWGTYVRDRTAKTTSLVTRFTAAGGTAISDTGRYVAFATEDKVLTGDTNNVSDVYLRDRTAKTTTRISLKSDGTQAFAPSGTPVMSRDARYVVFVSEARLIPADGNGALDVYVRDRTLGRTSLLSVGPGDAIGNRGSWGPSISSDGRHVAFSSDASNLVSGDTNGQSDAFVRDMFGE